MGYLDKEYSYSELETLYNNAKEYCESRDSQYSIIGTYVKNRAMKKATRMATKGAAGVVAGATGTNKEDVQNLMIGAGRMSGIGKAVYKGRMRRAMGNSMIGKAVAPMNKAADKLMGVKTKVNPLSKSNGGFFGDVAAVTGQKAEGVISTAKSTAANVKAQFKSTPKAKIQTLPKEGSIADKAIKDQNTSTAEKQNIKSRNDQNSKTKQKEIEDNSVYKNLDSSKRRSAADKASTAPTGNQGIFNKAKSFFQNKQHPAPTSDTSQGGISSAKTNGTQTSKTNQSSDTSQGGISTAKTNGTPTSSTSPSSDISQGGISTAKTNVNGAKPQDGKDVGEMAKFGKFKPKKMGFGEAGKKVNVGGFSYTVQSNGSLK